MKTNNVITLVVASIIGLILATGVLIPIVESSAYTVIDNGESDGMRYTFYEGNIPTEPYQFKKTSSTYTLTYGSNTMTGDLVPMLIFATPHVCVFVDTDLSIKKISRPMGTLFVNVETLGDSVTFRTFVNTTVNGVTHGAPSFAYYPDVNGMFGSYDHGGIVMRDTDNVIAVGVSGNKGAYKVGDLDYIDPSFSGLVYSPIWDGDVLESVSWRGSDSSSPVEIPTVDRDSLVELGNVVQTVALVPLEGGPEYNVTLYDDYSYRLNSIASSNYAPILTPPITYNGHNYTCKIIGDGSNPVLGAYDQSILETSMVTIDMGVKIINDRAFYNTKIMDYTINEMVEIVGDYAFYGSGISTYSGNIKYVGDYAFANTNINSSINTDGTIYVGDHAFENTRVTSVYVYGEVIRIGDYAFANCDSLTDVIIPDDSSDGSVYDIGDYAFANNLSFNNWTITVPEYVLRVGDHAFDNVGATSVVNLSSAEYGEDVFANNPLVRVTNFGGVLFDDSIVGVSNVPIQNGLESVFYVGVIYDSVAKDGIVWDIVVLLPIFAIVGVLIAIGYNIYTSRV